MNEYPADCHGTDEDDLNTSRGFIESEHGQTVLGKIWLLEGTEICQNDVGVSLVNCLCYIEEDFKANISDNRLG